MATYPTMKGVDRPLEASGLKGQYIGLTIITFVILFILTVIISNMFSNLIVVIPVVLLFSFSVISFLVYVNKTYGINGIMKLRVKSTLPYYIKNNSQIKNIVKNNYAEHI